MYVNDNGGIKTYSTYLTKSLKKKKIDVKITNSFDEDYPIYHIQFENSLFQPFGMKLIPKIISLKSKGKKIILTMHTVTPKKEIYARNNLIKLLKRIILPVVTKFICRLCDRVIVHREVLKEILIKEYHIKKNKIEVIAHGVY